MQIGPLPGAFYIPERHLFDISMDCACFDPIPYLARALGNGFRHDAAASSDDLKSRCAQGIGWQRNGWPCHLSDLHQANTVSGKRDFARDDRLQEHLGGMPPEEIEDDMIS